MDMLRRYGVGHETMESVRGRKRSLGWKGFVEQEGFEPGVKQRRSDGWWEWRVDGGSWGSRCKKRWVGVGEVGAMLSQRSGKLIPEKWWSILKWTVSDP